MAQTFLKVTHKIIDKNTGAMAVNDVNGMEIQKVCAARHSRCLRKCILMVICMK